MREEFVNFPPADGSDCFTVDLAGISYCDGSYLIHREYSSVAVVEYVVKGKGYIEINDQKYTACEGDIYLLPAGCCHLYYSDGEDPWEKIWMNVAGPLADVLIKECNPGGWIVFHNAGGRNFFEQIHDIGRNTEYTAPEKHRRSALVFHQLLQYLYDKFYTRYPDWPEETVRMKAYLDNHITRNITLKELGQLVYLSESQVVRCFKRDLGITPHEYILHLKMEEAGKLLKNTRLMVREISDYLGFCDEHYFSALFRKKMGMTPLEYRKM